MRVRLMMMAACLSLAGCGGGDVPADEPGEQPPAEQQPAQTEPIRSDFARSAAADTGSAEADADATAEACHPSYPDFCLPPPPPDMNCKDVTGKKPFVVRHDVPNPDPHAFDRDQDGRACEPRPRRRGGK